jgi:heat shock protein HslJ
MRVHLNDGSTQFRQVTINVIQPIAPPTVQPLPTQPIAPPLPPIAVDPLAGTRWEVVNFNNGQGAVVGLVPGTKITLDFGTSQVGQASGRAGCNTYFAQYQVGDPNGLTIGRPGATTLLCATPEGVMQQEQQYLAALQSAATFQLTGDQLQIRAAGDALAVVATRVR